MNARRGLTLVEMLVVIAIIGVLVGLLLPAVQSAREGSRQVYCRNNLKQIGVSVQQHIDVQGYFPSGGWGYNWTGDPNRGFDYRQPGSWVFNILPYNDCQSVRDTTDIARRNSMPVPYFNCPTRRTGWGIGGSSVLTQQAKSDYAANAYQELHPNPSIDGGLLLTLWGSTPVNQGFGDPAILPTDSACATAAKLMSEYPKMQGVVFGLSTVRPGAVLDGLSMTYLVAEKLMEPRYYLTGQDGGDRNPMYTGGGNCKVVLRAYPGFTLAVSQVAAPNRDFDLVPSGGNHPGFGSAHSQIFNVAFCDGSTRAIPYFISSDIHISLGSRNDGVKTGKVASLPE